MTGVDIWDIENNFWACNPHFKVPEAFQKLYTKDKSKNKTSSSQIMWALALYIDFGSKFKDLEENERKQLIIKDFIKDEFSFDDYKEQLKTWELFKSPAQKQLSEWSRLMNEKTEYMKSLKYSRDNAEHIEELLLSNSKLYDAYEKLLAKLSQEQETGVVKGDGEESLSEKGFI